VSRAIIPIAVELLLGLMLLGAGLAVTAALVPLNESGVGLSLALYGLMAFLIWRAWRPGQGAFGWPNRVTLLRGLLLAWLVSWVTFPSWLSAGAWTIVIVVFGILILDGIDGFLARRLDQSTGFGARFDMEVDAALIMLLCVLIVQAELAGPWVLLIGLLRYGFVLAAVLEPRLSRALPDSRRRKIICVWQIASLILAFVPGISAWLIVSTLALALGLLIFSFALDVRWLLRRHPGASTIERSTP